MKMDEVDGLVYVTVEGCASYAVDRIRLTLVRAAEVPDVTGR